LTGKSNAELPLFVKKSIGAFWGMVFKFGLEYNGQKSVSVSMNEYFKVKTATYFTKSEVYRSYLCHCFYGYQTA